MSKTLIERSFDRITHDTATPEEIQEEMQAYAFKWAKEHGVGVDEASAFFYMASEYTIRLALANQREEQSKSSTEPSGTCNC
jgi:hypothetical protein